MPFVIGLFLHIA